MRIGQIIGGVASRAHAQVIDEALASDPGVEVVHYDGPATQGLPAAWSECDIIVSYLALGATTRIIAPLLQDKKSDPGVVVIDEAARFVVPLVGGHAGGANEIARRLADVLGATAVLTTATDSVGIPALDTLGWPYRGDVAGVTRAVLDGRAVCVQRTQPWPLPPLPATVLPEGTADAPEPTARILVTDETVTDTGQRLPTVVLTPKSLVVGMGCNSGTAVEHLEELLDRTLAEHGLAREAVTALTTADVKAGEIGLLQLAKRLGVALTPYAAPVLAAQDVPTPSEAVRAHVGTPSVSEASVLAHGADLLVPKQRTAEATCAVGRMPARGRLAVVGLGPGSRDLLTPRAVEAIRRATFVVGYGPYVKQIRDLVRPGVEIMASKMGTEEARTTAAIERARAGENVALVCSGDAGVYAMASPVLEQGTVGIDVEVVPGVTASLAVSSILGAPLGHDHVTLSLSDLHTDWATIERRIVAAAEGDFVTALYNPRSRTRLAHLPRALEIMREHRPASTPVAVVRQACRPQQEVTMSTLEDFDVEWVDMNSLVVIGSSSTRFVLSGSDEQRIVTPRDYQWMSHHTEEVSS